MGILFRPVLPGPALYTTLGWIFRGIQSAGIEQAFGNLSLKNAPVGKHCDGAGLWLVKREDGGAQWVLRVTVHGRRREMGLGGFPTLKLTKTRKLATR